MLVPQCVEATPELLKTPHQGVLGSPNQVLFRRSMDEKTRQTPVLFLHDNSFFLCLLVPGRVLSRIPFCCFLVLMSRPLWNMR